MPYNVSADLWYQYFNADGPQWLILLAFYGFRSLWTTLGLCFNSGLVYITAKNKTFRGACNLLLAMESSFALLQDASYLISFGIVLSGIRFVRFEYCFWALIPCCLCGDAAQMTMVCTGIDRLCCVLFPVWYKRRSVKMVLSLVVAVLCCYLTYDFVLNYVDYQNSRDFLVSCSTHDMFNGGLGWVMRINGLVLSGILMTVYGICWVTVFQLSTISQTVNENNRKLIKSLMFIIGLNLIGVFVKGCVSLLFQYFVIVNVFAKIAFTHVFSLVTIAVYSSNAPVLYIFSNEYRTRFDQHFPWLAKLWSSSRVSTVVSVVQQSSAPSIGVWTHYKQDGNLEFDQSRQNQS